MSRKSQKIPQIQFDADLDRETARQIVEGVRDFTSELRTADECGAAPAKSEASKKLHILVDQVLTLDLALPSGVKLGLLAIDGSHWKKPWEDLKKSLSQWKPQPEGRYERIIPAFGDMDEPSGFLETEAERKQRLAQAKAERQALAKIAKDLDCVLNMLTQLSQAAELRLLGKKGLTTPRTRKTAREKTETRLREFYMQNQWLIESLAGRIAAGDTVAIRIAKKFFGRNALVRELGLAEGTVSESKVFARLREELRLGEKLSVRVIPVDDELIDIMSDSESISVDTQLLLDRLNRCSESQSICTPELSHFLRNEILNRVDSHEKVEQVLDKLERGENPLATAAPSKEE